MRLLATVAIGLTATIALVGSASGKPATEAVPNLTAGLAHKFAERTVGKLGSYGYETEHHSYPEGIEKTVSFEVSVSKISGRCIEVVALEWGCPFYIDQHETIDEHRDSWVWEGEVHPEQNTRLVKCQVLKAGVGLFRAPLSEQKRAYPGVHWKTYKWGTVVKLGVVRYVFLKYRGTIVRAEVAGAVIDTSRSC